MEERGKMKKEILLTVLTVAASILVLLLISGCSELDVKGNPVTNLAPTIEWADDAGLWDGRSYSSNPVLKWVPKDSDGLVVDNFYIVLLGDYVDDMGGPDEVIAQNAYPDTTVWTSLGEVSEAYVPLYASADTSVYVEQYVFMRCVDDVGDSSSTIHLFLSRNNHPPTCIIVVPEGPQWCLPDTNSSWNGIPISWEGGDSLDFPGAQPDFLWEVKAFGPYLDLISAENAMNDFNPDTEPLYGQAVDPVTGEPLVEFESINMLNLVTGFYIMYVRNFDDAFVPADPAMDIIEVYEPHWIRHSNYIPIAVIDHGKFTDPTVWGDLSPDYKDSVTQFYNDMLLGAGITSDQYDFIDATPNAVVTVHDLYKYRLVIALDTDWTNLIPALQQEEYARYLDVGGQLWLTGRRSFNAQSGSGHGEFGDSSVELPFRYMNLDGNFLNTPSERDVTDFVGASPLISGFPEISVDTIKVGYTSWGPYNYSQSLFGICYLIRQLDSETIYKFNAEDPFNSPYEAFPVAIRYDSGSFKTSYFAFPLYFCDLDDAIVVAQNMLDWYEL
jgi:hypothetical protein